MIPEKDLKPELSSSLPCLPPRTGQLPEALGGGQDYGCAPPFQDGPKLVSPASLSIPQAQKELQGL